ncbi:MAG: lysophospholipid acyltransferase family protein [Chloroflexi bacterium]|nr:lysophospholipid acyltransferase family protein [Chloroflexota bacterium]
MWRYYAFRFAGLTLAHLPMKVGYLIAFLVADTVYTLSPGMRAAILDNMRHVLGSEASDVQLKQATHGVLRNAARNYFDLIKIPHMKSSEIESLITLHGWHNLEHALDKGKGVILVTAHLGSFELASQLLAVRSIKTTVLVESLEPPALLNHVTALRSSKGLTCVAAQSGALEIVIQSLRRGEVVLFACDRDIAKDGFKSDFFDEETSLPAEAVRIAMRTGAAVLPAFSLRRNHGKHDIYCEPAMDIALGRNGAVARNIQQVIRVMEKYIRACPEQWVVLGRAWPDKQEPSSLSETLETPRGTKKVADSIHQQRTPLRQ